MYQFTIRIGESATADVVVDLAVLPGTALPQGTVGLQIGTTTGQNGPMLMRHAAFAVEQLQDNLKAARDLLFYYAVFTPGPDTVAFGVTNTATEDTLAAAIDNGATGQRQTSSLLYQSGLQRCLDRFRDELNAGNLPLLSQ